ncbi:ABC transporter ATP-binding protein [Treponema pectinovorum]|uniref:ABC transporter ATP-binding protein n=1 Tax=Treponema pectinovorum TaxID=164 RepID=UPI0011CBE09C|nr:ABC transporter ATP-binding protein [Treponema pectinovorum]
MKSLTKIDDKKIVTNKTFIVFIEKITREKMIQLKDFTKFYGDLKALDKVSLTFKDNSITGILGLNGAGKTTLLKALTGRHFASEGEVLFFLEGEESFNATDFPTRVRQITGFVQENATFINESQYTVQEYLSFVASIHSCPKKNVLKTLEQCSLLEVKNQKIKNLSKGFRERVNFAQALVYEPKILVLDEPASGLDPNQIANMRSLVKDLGKNHTIVLSTHLMQEAQALCQNIVILDKGKFLIQGTIEEICLKTGAKNLEEAFFSLTKTEQGIQYE